MQQVLDFIENNPLLVGIVLTLIESALMPLIPIKWNGVALFLLNLAKAKFGKATSKVVPIDPEQERRDKIKADMEDALNALNKESAAKKLVE